jgi:hypothetical protein
LSSAAGSAAKGEKPEVVDPSKSSWIEFELVDDDSSPVAFEPYVVELPDGSTVEGNLDALGQARLEGIDPGTCKISYPNQDKDSWEPK